MMTDTAKSKPQDAHDLKILYCGTPDFARIPLEALYSGGYNITAVLTQPDKPSGRGYALTQSPVKLFAADKGIPVYQPRTLRDEAFAALLSDIAPDLIIVTAYGKILPPAMLEYPKYGCINIHGSLLPKYRGAAPIQRAIIAGEPVCGITVMYMDKGVDTGNMIEKREYVLGENDNFETVHDRLAALGSEALLSVLPHIANGSVTSEKQDGSRASYAEKITKADMETDFSEAAAAVHNRIRGLSPYPLCFSKLNGKIIKLTSSHVSNKSSDAPCGTVVSVSDGAISVACADGIICIDGVIPEGKGKMTAADFIRGRKIAVGDVFGK